MKLNFKWKRKVKEYALGYSLWLNGLRLAEYSWNNSRLKGVEGENWVSDIALPGLREQHYKTSDEAAMRLHLEKEVTAWFEEALK